MNTKKIILSTTVSIMLLGLTGCAVKSDKLSISDIDAASKKDLLLLKQVPSSLDKPLSLNDAIDRAVKNNKDYKIKEMETAFESKQLDISNFNMWPSLNGGAGLTHRNNQLGSSSKSLLTGAQSLEQSTSYDKTQKTAEMKFSWNVLDFGLSYVRAKQQADKYLIAQERMRKVSHQIQQDVREAYWKAVSAQNLLSQIDPIIAEVQKSLAESEQLEEAQLGNMMESLNNRRELLNTLISLQSLKRQLISAKPNLSVLMGLAPGTKFDLSDKIEDMKINKVILDMQKMESLAFNNRPELMESRYQSRISLQETKASMLSLLPGLVFDTGYNYTSNSYTANNTWFDYGVRINMNLFKVFMVGDLMEKSKIGVNIAKEQELAVGMAVLTQVCLADMRYHEAQVEWEAASKYYKISKRISDIAENESLNNIGTKQHVVREKLSKLLANVKRDMAFAELQNSYGNLFVSLGLEQNKSSEKLLEGI